MATLLLRLDVEFETRRLIFLIVNGFFPFAAMFSILLLSIEQPNGVDFVLKRHAIDITGVSLCIVSVIVGTVLLRCHYNICLIGSAIYERLGIGTPEPQGFNYQGVFASVYALSTCSLLLGVLLVEWANCISATMIFISELTIIVVAAMTIKSVQSAANQHLNEENQRHISPISNRSQLADEAREHGRQSLRNTYADLSVGVLVGLAIYTACFGLSGAISNGLNAKIVCSGMTDRNLSEAQPYIIGYGFITLFLTQVIILRLRCAKEEFSARLTFATRAKRNVRWHTGLDRIFLLHFLLGLFAATTLFTIASYWAESITASIIALLYVSIGILWYIGNTRNEVDKHSNVSAEFPIPEIEPESSEAATI